MRTGIVHLGLGSFNRAHQALATQHAIEIAGSPGLEWGIAAVGMRRSHLIDTLRHQNGLYTVLEHGSKRTRAEVVGVFSDLVHAPTDSTGVHHRIANPDVKLVTLTVTASGYSLDPFGELDPGDDDVVHDLSHPDKPITTVGMVSRGLARVRELGHRPPAIISCDNLNTNGTTLRDAVVAFAELNDPTLSGWISRNVQFPNTVVDRIAAQTSDNDLAEVQRLIGLSDKAPVPTEPFFNWVIEEFDGPRPRWEEVGARFVTDCGPYELGKLRLLNGVHMLLAYVGGLAGLHTIAEASSDPSIEQLARMFMLEEAGNTLPISSKNLSQTVDDLMDRFQNPAIRHDMARIGRNGSDKMVPRVLEAMRENLDEGRPVPAGILLIAAWIRWFVLDDVVSSDHPIDVTDPLDDELKALARSHEGDPVAQARAFLNREDIFGERLPHHEQVTAEVARAIEEFTTLPVREVVDRRLTAAHQHPNPTEPSKDTSHA